MFRCPKKEKLKHKKDIELLFEEGNLVTVFPLRLVFKEMLYKETCVKAGFSVSKKAFKFAVKRNRIKRLMREAYRQEKHLIFNNSTTSYAFMFLYLGKKEPSLKDINDAMKKVLTEFIKTTS